MNIKKRIISVILLLGLVISLFLPFTVSAAETTIYSTVLEDLTKDSSFNVNNYPANASDMSVKLIQIAEGENGELFVYVYQPADSVKDLKATHINMSTHHYEDETQNYKLYPLTWVNSYGTLDKYVVNDFKVSSDLYRYYNIATIYRAFDESIDTNSIGSDDITNYKGFSVAKCIVACNSGDSVIYDAKDVSVAEVEITSVGIVRYKNGFLYSDFSCDSHFVAFNVNNFDVKDIYSVTISYTIAEYTEYSQGAGLLGPEETKTVDFLYNSKGSNEIKGFFAYYYEWPRIQTSKEFGDMINEFENEKIIYDYGSVGGSEFVFNFLETEYVDSYTGVKSSQRVTNVGLLRLHFATDTGVYNLGVVSDLVSDDSEPDFDIGYDDNFENVIEEMEDFFEDFLAVVIILILVVFLIALAPTLQPIFEMIFDGIKEVFSSIWAAIKLPFEFIGSLFTKKRK